MNKKFKYIEQIERYLEGKMSGEESETFESLLNNDPALKSQLQLQQDILSTIKETRKAELKARLNNINVGTYNGGLTGAKVVLTGMLTAAIGLGIYFYAQDEANKTDKIDLVNEEMFAPQMEESILIQPEVKHNTSSISVESNKIEEKKTKEAVADKYAKEKKTVAPAQENKETEAVVTIKKINTPSPIESFEEDVEEKNPALQAPKNKLAEAITSSEAATAVEVEVESKEDNNHNFHYKFYNNKLYLYGDFKNIPYELIELNTVSGKSLYLYYKDSFYYLEANQMEISPLNQIKDGNLIEELNGLRKQ